MLYGILVVSAVIFLCILANKFSDKFGMPTLILFMFIGMLFGSDGIVKIPFDNYELAERVCSIALIFIMDMGITKGVEIYVRKVAPLGDPVEVTVRGYELSLRKEDAQMIEVE